MDGTRRSCPSRLTASTRWGGVLLLLCCAGACGGQTGSEGFDDDAPPGPSATGGSAAEGSGGSGGVPGMNDQPGWCATDTECMGRLEQTVADLAEPRPTDPRTLVAATCEPADATQPCPRPQSCKCVFTTRNRLGEINAEAYALGLGIEGDGCDARSRGGECLVAVDDFAGCEPGDDCSCADSCAHALTVMTDDAASTLDLEARHAECVDNECRVVLRIGERCYATFTPHTDSAPYDCSLSDDEILRRAYPPGLDAGPAADCSGGCDAGGGIPAVSAGGASCAIGVSECSNCYDDAPPLDCSEPDAG